MKTLCKFLLFAAALAAAPAVHAQQVYRLNADDPIEAAWLTLTNSNTLITALNANATATLNANRTATKQSFGSLGTITTNQTITLSAGITQHTALFTTALPANLNIVLSTANATAGATVNVYGTITANTANELSVRNASTGGTLLSTFAGDQTGAYYGTFTFNGTAWVKQVDLPFSTDVWSFLTTSTSKTDMQSFLDLDALPSSNVTMDVDDTDHWNLGDTLNTVFGNLVTEINNLGSVAYADAQALKNLSTATGIVARTAEGTYALRTITGPAAGISVSNGNGVSGNPTLALANDLAALEALSSTGYLVRTAAETFALRTFTGTNITITDGNGVAGSTNIALPTGVVTPGTYGTAQIVPVFTVDSTGRVTGVTNTTAAIPGTALAAARLTALNAPRLASNGTAAALTVLDNAALATNGADFGGFLAVTLADYTPTANITLAAKFGSNLGWKLNLLTTGNLQLQLGNGSDFTTYSYNSTAAVTSLPAFADGSPVGIGWSADRDGNLVFAVDGQQLGANVSIAGSVAQNVTNTGNLTVLSEGSTHASGEVYGFTLFNYAPPFSNTTAFLDLERLTLRGVLPEGVLWANAVAYTSNFTAGGTDGWGAPSLITLTTRYGPSDVNTDAALPNNGWLRVEETTSTSNFASIYLSSLNLKGKRVRVTFDLFKPTAITVGSVKVYDNILSATTNLVGNFTTVNNGVNSYAVEFDCLTGSVALIASASAFLNSLGLNDYVYYKNITISTVGAVASYQGQTLQDYQWQDPSPQKLNAILPASGTTPYARSLNGPYTVRGTMTWTSSAHDEQVFIGDRIIIPAGATVTSIAIESSQDVDFTVGSDSSGSYYLNAADYGGATGFKLFQVGLERPAADGEIWVDPSANSGTLTVSLVVTYVLNQ